MNQYTQPVLTPTELDPGIPSSFSQYRLPYQWDAIDRSLRSGKRFTGVCIPTGGGKSLIALSAAILSGCRVAIVVSTKAQQDQMLSDFAGVTGLVDIRGHVAYACNPKRQDTGEYVCGQKNQCPYLAARRSASKAKIILTNYAFWIADRIYSSDPVTTDVDLLCMDECHLAFNDVSNALTLFLSPWFFNRYVEFWPQDAPELCVEKWIGAITLIKQRAKGARDEIKVSSYGNRMNSESERTGEYLDNLTKMCDRFLSLVDGDGHWVVRVNGTGAEFRPVWVSKYTQQYVFGDVGKVICLSATMTSKTMSLLGIPKEESVLLSYPSIFPQEHRPVWYIPTARINYRSDDLDMNVVLSRVDQVIRDRLDRKGILHTVSYKRAAYVAERSLYKEIVQTHGPGQVSAAVKRFKESLPPALLASPAIGHGYDFPGETAEYNIQMKVPWPDTKDPLIKRRSEEDPEYAPDLTMQAIVQYAGRTTRTPADISETFIFDDNWKWFWPKYRHLAASWFEPMYSDVVPKPPTKSPQTVGSERR